MILCSCNLLSSNNIKDIVESYSSYRRIPSVQEIMEKHGCSVVCATCTHNIKLEIRKHYESNTRTIS